MGVRRAGAEKLGKKEEGGKNSKGFSDERGTKKEGPKRDQNHAGKGFPTSQRSRIRRWEDAGGVKIINSKTKCKSFKKKKFAQPNQSGKVGSDEK